MAGGTLFEAHAVLVAPAALSTADLRAALEALADELLVDIELAEDPSAALTAGRTAGRRSCHTR